MIPSTDRQAAHVADRSPGRVVGASAGVQKDPLAVRQGRSVTVHTSVGRFDSTTDLLCDSEKVGVSPPLCDPFGVESHDVEGLDRNCAVGRRKSEEWATVGSAPNDVSSYEVALAEHGFDRANEVGKR